jgi:hypothetical protein
MLESAPNTASVLTAGVSAFGLNRRLLLGQAMEGAEAPDQFRAIDRDDPPFRETILEDFVSAFVVGRTEHGQ